MKKRVFSALICAVIAALSILTAFSGCTGTSYPKVVADRDEFFSKIAGWHGSNYYDTVLYIFEGGKFQISYTGMKESTYKISDSTIKTGYSSILYNYVGNFKTIYQDSEFSYHTEISKLNKSVYVKISPLFEPSFEYAEDGIVDPSLTHIWDFYSNDILYIFAPGMPVSEIPMEAYDTGYFDADSDGKLDSYLIENYTKRSTYAIYGTFSVHEDYINNGVWVDYNSSDSTIDIYNFNHSNNIEVTTYNLSGNKLTKIEATDDKLKPVYYTTCGSNVIISFDNGKANVICPTNDINKMKYFTEATDGSSKSPHKFIHYDKLPDYNTIVKEKAGNQ